MPHLYFKLVAASALSLMLVSKAIGDSSAKVGDLPVTEILKRLGAEMEAGVTPARLAEYSRHFDRVDFDSDGRHSKTEYIEKGTYLTPMARRGIFNAADSNGDGVVTKAEYTLNRIITDEAKGIIQAMDDNGDRKVSEGEFTSHAGGKLGDKKLARQVFLALDTDGNGSIHVPEYLRVWGKWARTGGKAPDQRLAAQKGAGRDAGHGTLIFEDDFERSESQESKDEIGKGWGSNSARRAAGNKQVDLKDGAMYIYRHEVADHGVSVTHPAEFRDGTVGLRFMLENKKDSLGLNFADLKFKEVHAGHLFAARIGIGQVTLQDLKTGNMNLKTRELRKANKLTPEQKKQLRKKERKFSNKLETGKWYDLLVNVRSDELRVVIDGKEIGSFKSEGIAHPTKRTLRLAVPRNAVVDDVKIWKKG